MRDNVNFVNSPDIADSVVNSEDNVVNSLDNVDSVVNSPDGKIHTEAAHSQLEKVSPLFLWSDEIFLILPTPVLFMNHDMLKL